MNTKPSSLGYRISAARNSKEKDVYGSYPEHFNIPEMYMGFTPRAKAPVTPDTWENLLNKKEMGWADFDYLFKDDT